MKKFLVVLLPVMLIGSLATVMFVAAQNISPCPVAWERPEVGWTQPATPAKAMPGSSLNVGWFEVWAVDHEWNEDGTALLSRTRMRRGAEHPNPAIRALAGVRVGSPFAPPHPQANPGGFVNIRSLHAPGGRAIPAEYGNVITQVPSGTEVWVDGRFYNAWTAGGCSEWWVVVTAGWFDVNDFWIEVEGVMISSMLVDIGLLYYLGGDVERATWVPGPGAVRLW